MTSDVKNIYSNVDPILLDFSMIDYFVLQRLSIHKVPIVRYQLMKNIRNYLPNVSTAKFYRILEKFEKFKFVETLEDDDRKISYILSPKGNLAIPQIQQLVNQFGYNIFIHFGDQWSQMFELIEGRSKVVGFVDYENLLEISFVELYLSQVDKLYLGCDTEFFDYISSSYPQVKQLIISSNEIKEPDNYFDSFVVFLHDNVNLIIEEIYRILKPNGVLILVEVSEPNNSHFVNKILFEQFAPDHLKKTKKPMNLKRIQKSGMWKIEKELDLESLKLTSLIKVV